MTFCKTLLINLFLVCLAIRLNAAEEFEGKSAKRLKRDNHESVEIKEKNDRNVRNLLARKSCKEKGK